MNKKIKDLQDGDKLSIKLLISQTSKGVTNKGAPYLNFVLQDNTGSMDAKYWNVTEEQLSMYKAGMICLFKVDILSHNKALQIRIQSIEILNRKDEDLKEFVKSSPYSKEMLKNKIFSVIDHMENKTYKEITRYLVEQDEKDFFTYPAASRIHHDFVGGLATHVLGMIRLGENLCDLYPMLDKDLLMSGIILHDIGKLTELSGPVITEYTLEGKLLGHISIMHAKVSEAADKLSLQGEEVTMLRHMILSHHGEYEYGSPVLPMLPEAEILNYIDNIDARMNTLEKAMDQTMPGEFTPKLFALENRSFYKKK